MQRSFFNGNILCTRDSNLSNIVSNIQQLDVAKPAITRFLSCNISSGDAEVARSNLFAASNVLKEETNYS